MDTNWTLAAVPRQLAPHYIEAIFQRTLSLGQDMDQRGLHWRLAPSHAPQQRLGFALAVYYSGGAYLLIDAQRGFLCVDCIRQCYAKLQQVRQADPYQCGHAFAQLHEALGYGPDETAGFSLIQPADLRSVEGFIAGFSDSMAQSLEADVTRIIRGDAAACGAMQIDNLRRFIADLLAGATLADDGV